jgi:hypothetical protein
MGKHTTCPGSGCGGWQGVEVHASSLGAGENEHGKGPSARPRWGPTWAAAAVAMQILDVLDCTGSGDIAMQQVERLAADGTLAGASGRRLTPNPNWANPSGTARILHSFGLMCMGGLLRAWPPAQRS